MIGDNIKKFRLKDHLTQEELADWLDVTRQTVSNWECGKAEPDLGTIHALAAVFHTSIDTLIHGRQRYICLPLPDLTEADRTAFDAMLTHAWERIEANPAIRQVFALHTVKGNTYYQDVIWEGEFWTPGDFRGEEAAIAHLVKNGDTQVRCFVHLWNNGDCLPQPEPTSWYFAQRLLETDARNLNALGLLWGGDSNYVAKPMYILAPPNMVKRSLQEKP